MQLCLFLLLFSISSPVFAELVCPYGCGSDSDPDVEAVGNTLLKCLQKIDFLEERTEVSSADGEYGELYDQVLSGENWEIYYEAAYNRNVDLLEEDEEETDFFVSEFHFSRDKRSGELPFISSEFLETNLLHYLETNAFIQTVFADLIFSFDFFQNERWRNIENYKRKIASNLNLEEIPLLQASIDLELCTLGKETHEHSRRLDDFIAAKARIDAIYRLIFNQCVENHGWVGSLYCRGLLNFQDGYFDDAFFDVSNYLNFVEIEGEENSLPAEAYFYKGVLESEVGAYNSAIESLSEAIKKNPNNKEAFFERAVAYYEAGEFDLSLNDYLTSGIRPCSMKSASVDIISFSRGMAKGILAGGAQGSIEFIPSLLSSVHGIGHGLWAFSQDPVQTSVELVQSAQACIQYLRENTPQKAMLKLIPELKGLFEDWDQLESGLRGEIIGKIIGKYGIDVFAGSGVAKAVKLYRNFKRADALITFEALRISEKNRALIKLESIRRVQARQEILSGANLKIQWDKQGKHIQTHKNFSGKNKSILMHPDPQKLVNDFCGKGIKAHNHLPGTPGYQEIVDFGEFIGYSVRFDTGEKIATNWGKIHYAKDGVHIVPTEPRW
ncbi:MAG: tetratricopeptide repeat protein [Rhabdochlamydiaceae bacterium]|nr:tetratricopeptide repeat protein [Rhabdochlamydiaceae bacterium]